MCCMFAAVWLALGAGAGPFQDSVPATPPAEWLPAERQVREEDQRIYAALDEIVPAAVFEDMPLAQVLQWFAEIAKINVHVEWRDLEDNAIVRDRPITLAFHNLPRWRVLRAALETASGEARLGYEVRDGVLLIATRDLLDRDMITRLYPVRDLLYTTIAHLQQRQAAATPGAPGGTSAADLAKATDAGYREELARRSMLATQPAAAAREVEETLLPNAEAELLDVLRQSVEPDAWRENGGSGSAQIYNGVLVVRQCRTAHRGVERLLADLRATGAADNPTSRPAPPTMRPRG
jgi:hypothetical protein